MRAHGVATAALAVAIFLAGCQGPASLRYEFSGLGSQKAGRQEEAIGFFTEALRDNDLAPAVRANVLCWRSTSYVIVGDYDHAIEDLTLAIRLKPGDECSHSNRGIAYLKKGLLDLARADFRVARDLRAAAATKREQVNLNIRFGEAEGSAIAQYVRRGQGAFQFGDYPAAMAYFDAAVDEARREDVQDALPFGSRGLAKLSLGQYAEAGKDLAQAARRAPGNADYVLWLHVARQRAGIDDQEEYARNATRLDQTDWPAMIVALYLGRPTKDRIRGEAARTRVAAPPDRSMFFSTGEMQNYVNQRTAARKSEVHACLARLHLGEFALLRGDRAGARDALAAAFDPCRVMTFEPVLAANELAAAMQN